MLHVVGRCNNVLAALSGRHSEMTLKVTADALQVYMLSQTQQRPAGMSPNVFAETVKRAQFSYIAI